MAVCNYYWCYERTFTPYQKITCKSIVSLNCRLVRSPFLYSPPLFSSYLDLLHWYNAMIVPVGVSLCFPQIHTGIILVLKKSLRTPHAGAKYTEN